MKSLLAAFALCLSLHAICAANAPPNIVLILADDQGWNGTSVQMDPNVPDSKSDYYQTPRLEQLAAQGMRFSQAYASSPVCATTRAAINTGRSHAQLQMGDMPHGQPGTVRWESFFTGLPLTPPAPPAFDPTGLTLPRIIKEADSSYQTALIGKWHLNYPDASITPQATGYDYAIEPPFPSDDVDPWGVFDLAQRGNAFMEEKVAQGQPFFLQIAHKAVHNPVRARPELIEKYENLPKGTVHRDPAFAAMTEDLDTSLGMTLDKIQELGIADNTYIIYASDNGSAAAFSSNLPLRRGKATIEEGGIRSPFVVRGPGISANTFSDVPITTTDLYSTIASMAGFQGTVPSNVEAADFLPVLHNEGQLPAGMDHLVRNFHEGGEVYFHWPMNFAVGPTSRVTRPASAIRDGDYKLKVEYGESGGSDRYYLYNLKTDVRELTNLATSMPDKLQELKTKLETYLEDIDAPFAFDVKQNIVLDWDASQPGAEVTGWRSNIRLKYKRRETWDLGKGANSPQLVNSPSFQPGLSDLAFSFDGNDKMERIFFQVGDDGPRKNTVSPGTPDWNRSASMEFWVRLDSLIDQGILMESGDGTGGISLTLGDANNDGFKNDLRFRILGLVGADTGVGTLESFTATTRIDQFADPTQDYVHLVAVFNDDPLDRYQEIYVNGALAARVVAPLGQDHSPQWDTYDMAGLGNVGGKGLGANGGSGDLPFQGGLKGSIAKARYYNYAVSSSDVQNDYNQMLSPSDAGILALSGDAVSPAIRPTDLRLDVSESDGLQIIHERDSRLLADLPVDSILAKGMALSNSAQAVADSILAGTNISSYVMHFDPVGQLADTISGSVTFQGEILGILFDQNSLVSTDHLLGSIGNYGFEVDRGLTLGSEGIFTVSASGHQLSYNLAASGDESLQFRILTENVSGADFDHDGDVDDDDLAIWKSAFGTSALGDADQDGDTDGRDFLIWQRQASYLELFAADFNHDGSKNHADLQIWNNAFGSSTLGDANGDGVTDGLDFLIWQRQNLGTQAFKIASSAVPEPTSACLFAGLLFIACTKRKVVCLPAA